MAEIIGQPQWSPVRLLEEDEYASGGEDGNMNEQAKSLADRTEFLKENSASKEEVAAAYGGMYSFKTMAKALEAAVNKPIPADSKVEITDDGVNTGQYTWDGSNFSKSPYETVTKQQFPIVQRDNFYNPINNKTGFYIQPSDGAILTAENNIISWFDVRPGKKYAIACSDMRTAYLIVSLSNNNQISSGKKQTKVILSDTTNPNIKTFIVPADSDYKFAFLNVYWPNFQFDIRNSLIIDEDSVASVIKKILGNEIYDQSAHNKIRLLENKDFVSGTDITEFVNFYDPNQNSPDLYLASDTGLMTPLAGTAIACIPVKPGTKYTVKSSKFIGTPFVGLTTSAATAPANPTTKINLVATTDNLIKTFTVPEGTPYRYAFFTVLLPSQLYDVRDTLVVNEGVDKVVKKINGAEIFDPTARALIEYLAGKLSSIPSSNLFGKSLLTIGDSITEHNFRSQKNYDEYMQDMVGNLIVYNYGISNTGWDDRSNVASKITENPDYVTVFLGTNNFGGGGPDKPRMIPLGQFGDQTTATIAGSINILLRDLINKFPTKRIGIITPLPRFDNWGENAAGNDIGVTLKQISEMIIRYAKHYGLPYLDLYTRSNFTVYNSQALAALMPDGIHPNAVGHLILARMILKFLESI